MLGTESKTGKRLLCDHALLKVMPTVKDLMTKDVLTIDVNRTVVEAAVLMSQNDVGDLVVMENNTPVGIMTERDVVRRVLAVGKSTRPEFQRL